MPSLDLDNEDHDDDTPETPATLTPARALVDAILESAGRARLNAALAGGVPAVILIETASPDLAKLVATELTSPRRARIKTVTEVKKNAQTELIEQMLTTLGHGMHFVVLSHDLVGLLPGIVRTAADLVLHLPKVDRMILRAAIARLSGQLPGYALRKVPVETLELAGLLSALRPGSTAAQCVTRLRRLASNGPKLFQSAGGSRIEELPLSGPVKEWADDVLAQLRGIEAGDVPVGSLRHAVLEGPPGTGKTLIAGALATSTGWPVLATSIGEWFATSDGNLGGVSRACRAYFDGLLSQEKAIGFIDELDALPSRAALAPEDLQWWGTCITLVLNEIDRVRRSGKPILLVAATNYFSRLDQALVRPERLERRVPVYPPRTEAEIAAVFRYHLGGDVDDETISTVARLSVGASPAAIASMVQGARTIARKDGRPLVAQDLIVAASPPDRRPPAELRKVAIHEAGHVVAAHLLGFHATSVSIIASGQMGGVTRMRDLPPAPDRQELEALVMMHLGGRAADMAVGQGAHAGAAEDLATATSMISDGICRLGLYGTLTHLDPDSSDLCQEIEAHLSRLLRRIVAVIKANAEAVRALAEALLARRILNEEEINRILEASLAQVARQRRAAEAISTDDTREKRNG